MDKWTRRKGNESGGSEWVSTMRGLAPPKPQAPSPKRPWPLAPGPWPLSSECDGDGTRLMDLAIVAGAATAGANKQTRPILLSLTACRTRQFSSQLSLCQLSQLASPKHHRLPAHIDTAYSLKRVQHAHTHAHTRHTLRHRHVGAVHHAELRLLAPEAVHQGAHLTCVECARAQAHPHTERAQQQWHSELVRHQRDAGHKHHRAARLLEEAGRRRRRRVRQDVFVDQLQLRQLPRGTTSNILRRNTRS